MTDRTVTDVGFRSLRVLKGSGRPDGTRIDDICRNLSGTKRRTTRRQWIFEGIRCIMQKMEKTKDVIDRVSVRVCVIFYYNFNTHQLFLVFFLSRVRHIVGGFLELSKVEVRDITPP